MQTVPIFAYLMPILFLFGFGPVAALIATVIYAMPPMVRVTMLALRSGAAEIVDLGTHDRLHAPADDAGGSWSRRRRPQLMVGVNQVIMLSLNMVIIASMIGAGGLGYDVLTALRRLDIGRGLEAGLAIVVLADRARPAEPGLRHAAPDGARTRPGLRHGAYCVRRRRSSSSLGLLVPAIAQYPGTWQLSTGRLVGRGGALDQRQFLRHAGCDQERAAAQRAHPRQALPGRSDLAARYRACWPLPAGDSADGGWRLLVAALSLFIALTGQWEKAMVTRLSGRHLGDRRRGYRHSARHLAAGSPSAPGA